jgi:hypothetical protein
MKNSLGKSVQQTRQLLINELISSGIYKKNNKHLYELTLSELETEKWKLISNNCEGGNNGLFNGSCPAITARI